MATALKVNPTRINLLRLKRELKVAERGHKLLKDKRDGLMREFMGRVREVKELRARINPELITAFTAYASASAIMNPKKLANAFDSDHTAGGVISSIRSIMSVPLPSFGVVENIEKAAFPYGYLESYGNLDSALIRLRPLYADLVRLAELESAVERLAREIEQTRRRASALEHFRIPALRNTIKTITLRLDEQARDALISTMRVKANITNKGASEMDKHRLDISERVQLAT